VLIHPVNISISR